MSTYFGSKAAFFGENAAPFLRDEERCNERVELLRLCFFGFFFFLLRGVVDMAYASQVNTTLAKG